MIFPELPKMNRRTVHWASTAMVLNRAQVLGPCDYKMNASMDLGSRLLSITGKYNFLFNRQLG